MPLANETTVDLMCGLLSKDDYVCVADQLGQPCDVTDILELLFCMLRNPCLSNLNPTVNINWRARHLMNNILSKNPVLPPSFKVTEVIVPDRWNCVGHGGYGNVYTGKFCGLAVALKMLHKADDHLAYCREALMWRSLEHDFVLPFWRNDVRLEIRQQQRYGNVYVLSRVQTHPNGRYWKWLRAWNTFIQKAWFMGISENILLDDRHHIQIADFGLTRLLDATNTQSGAKHLNFAAPELFGCFHAADNPARTQMSDVYAFGYPYYEIHYDSIPYAGRNELQIMAHVTRGKHPPRQDESSLSDEAWELIQHCWEMNPSERPKMKGVTKRMKAICRPVPPLPPTVIEQPNTLSAQLSFSPRSDCVALLSLLDLLNDKQPGFPITSVVNATTNNLVYKLLSQKDYASVAKTLTRTSDVAIVSYQSIPATMVVSDVRMSDPRNCIGSGGFGRVFKGKLRGRGVALKMLNESDNDAAFCRESTSQCFLISPYMPNGTLAQWRKMNPSVTEIKKRILEVVPGVEYIHSEGVVHGGLRGVNIAVDANFRVQFALTRLSEATVTGSGMPTLQPRSCSTFRETLGSMNLPEQSCQTSTHSDAFVTRNNFEGITEFQILRSVSQGKRPPGLSQPSLTMGYGA